MSRMLSYYKSQLKSAAKSGPQLVTIDKVERFLDEKGRELFDNKKHAIVITFKNDNIEHEELYWIHGENHNKLLKLLSEFKLAYNAFTRGSLLNQKLWIVIRHNILIDDKQNEVKRESEIVHYSVDEQMPNYPTILEEYDIAAV